MFPLENGRKNPVAGIHLSDEEAFLAVVVAEVGDFGVVVGYGGDKPSVDAFPTCFFSTSYYGVSNEFVIGFCPGVPDKNYIAVVDKFSVAQTFVGHKGRHEHVGSFFYKLAEFGR